MKNRRSFLKKSAIGLLSTPFIPISKIIEGNKSNDTAVVKDAEQSEIFYVRPNTAIAINISKRSDNISSVSICTEELIPGSKIPMHKHLHEDEYFFIMKGTGIVVANDSEIPFKPGTSIVVPKDTGHEFRNTGNENVSFSFGFSPSGAEEFFKQIGTPKGQTFQQKPKEEFDALAAKFGFVFK